MKLQRKKIILALSEAVIEMCEKILKSFREKILSKNFCGGKIEMANGNIKIFTDFALGEINFYRLEKIVAEMSVTNLADGENKFYLHFELRDLNFAEEFFDEMLREMIDLREKKFLKILLTCTGGLTTGFFAEKLNETAKILSLNYKFFAAPLCKIYEVGFDYSVILLAPQIFYQADSVKNFFCDKKVLKIPAKIFAKYYVAALTEFIYANLENKKSWIERKKNSLL